MSSIWIVLPPWIYAVLVSMAGRWGQTRLLRPTQEGALSRPGIWPSDWGAILVTNLAFMSLIPISLLTVIGGMLPFSGARAGLSLGMLAFLFGCAPIRLLEAKEAGWDRTLWTILIDFIRVGGAMAIIGFLVVG